MLSHQTRNIEKLNLQVDCALASVCSQMQL